jgi:N-acetylglucosamine-6-phosphate deacetylase
VTRQAFTNGRVLSASGFVEGSSVLVEGGRISRLVPADDPACRNATQVDLRDGLLLPGFIDTQVNGGGGVLFNSEPTLEAIREIGRAHRRFGTTGFLPTLISDDLHVLARAVAAVQAALDAGVPGVIGIHIEGPFINVERKGVHDPAKFRQLDETAFRLLTSLRGGRTMVTLAPEMTTPQVIRDLTAAGVIVCAGHTNASYAVIRTALDHGLRGFTHLFNAMSQLTAREPGVVGAALTDPASWCGIIVDGRHVDPVVLRLAMRCKPLERFMLVTDAMANVGTDDTSFELQGRSIRVDQNAYVDEFGTLAGSHMDMATSVRNTIEMLGVALPDAVRMASASPAEFLGLSDQLGCIAAGQRANFVLADDALTVRETWIDGRASALTP